MILEVLESACMTILQGTTNPLVSVSTIHAKLEDEEGGSGTTGAELLEFLRAHPVVKVVDGEAYGLLGLDEGPWAILAERIPPDGELSNRMLEQLDSMGTALERALAEAGGTGDVGQMAGIQETLQRLDGLKAKVRKLFSSESPTGEDKF